MKRYLTFFCLAVTLLINLSCGTNKEPAPNYPSYLRIPASLPGYAGSGLVTVDGAVNLRAEGPETLDATKATYSGVLGSINAGFTAQFTVGQPKVYKQSGSVAAEYQANGQLMLLNTIAVGTYPMGYQSKPTATGVVADLVLNLPGPQLYNARAGTLTISESTLIKTEGATKLYRLQGSYQVAMFGTGVGAPSTKDYNVTGVFDLLLIGY